MNLGFETTDWKKGEDYKSLALVGAAMRNEREPKDRLVRGTCKLAQENDRNTRAETGGLRILARYDGMTVCHFLWPPCVADADIIFLPCDFHLLLLFFLA